MDDKTKSCLKGIDIMFVILKENNTFDQMITINLNIYIVLIFIYVYV